MVSHPAVVHFGVEAGPLVLQHGQVLLGLGGPGSGLLPTSSQEHGLTLVQQAVVLVGSLRELSLELLQNNIKDSWTCHLQSVSVRTTSLSWISFTLNLDL